MKTHEEIQAFEDFQRHSRQERHQYEAQRARLRDKVLAFSTKPGAAYRRVVDIETGEKSVEPIFTLADHDMLGAMRVSA